MPQVFRPSADTWLRVAVLVLIVLVVSTGALMAGLLHSDYLNDVYLPPKQPVPFSHQHHVAGLGLDCRYCHVSVETSSEAGLPPTHVCMTCHSQLYTEQEMLAPVRQSLAENRPLRWSRVVKLPGFVYFDHSIHIAKGVGCSDCHGRIDKMPLTTKAKPLLMEFCLDCHRDPAPHLRPLDRVTDMAWQPPADQRRIGERLIRERGIDLGRITDCYTCHR